MCVCKIFWITLQYVFYVTLSKTSYSVVLIQLHVLL